MPLTRVVFDLWAFQLLTIAVAIFALAAKGLQRRYRWFFVYLCWDLTMNAIGFMLGSTSRAYCDLYWYSQVPYLFLNVLVVWEIFSDVYDTYEGLRDLGRTALRQSIVSGLIVAAACLPLARSTWNCPGFQCHLFAFLELKRFFNTGLLTFTPLMLIRMSRVPTLRLWRNTACHAALFNASLLCNVVTGLVAFLVRKDQVTLACSVVVLAVNTFCYLGWAICLQRVSASRTTSLHDDASVALLFSQLTSFTTVCELIRKAARPFSLPNV